METSRGFCTFYGSKDESGPEASACSHNRYSLITPAFMQNWTVWRWEPSCARTVAAGSKPAVQLLAGEGQMKGEGWSWNQVEFSKFFTLVPVLNEIGCWKMRCLPIWSQDTECRQRRQGHRSADSWEPSHSPYRQHCPPGPARWRDAGGGQVMGAMQPVPGLPSSVFHTHTYPSQLMAERCAHHCMALCSSSHSLLSQA